MKQRIIFVFFAIAALAAATFAQEIDPVARAARWKEFNKFAFEKVDYSKTRLTRAKSRSGSVRRAAQTWAASCLGVQRRRANGWQME